MVTKNVTETIGNVRIITQHGHCWDDTTTPTTTDSGSGKWGKTSLGVKTSVGAFLSELTVLTAGTTYYIRAYAVNNQGTSYSSELTFVANTYGASSFPADAITRVTNLIHRYNRKEGVYILELSLGEVTSDFGLPEWLSRPQPSSPVQAEARKQNQDKASIQAAIEEAFALSGGPYDPSGAITRTLPLPARIVGYDPAGALETEEPRREVRAKPGSRGIKIEPITQEELEKARSKRDEPSRTRRRFRSGRG